MTPTKLAEIRERDRNAISRIGKPEEDPLLRAEIDRRLLLCELDAKLVEMDIRRRDELIAQTMHFLIERGYHIFAPGGGEVLP